MKNVIILVLLVSGGLVRAADVEKTLVAWVTLADRNVGAGSVLTVQRGDQFDGIVFAELAARKWMAGSNFFRRTQKAQGDYPAETAGGDALLQMAIVYEADRITLYRNGERYASYPAKNIDLLGHDDTFVVFGLRHVGNNRGRIAGKIDDARIYDRALTRKEIQSLQPNRESSIKPFAWWDFEGEKIVDRAGRYPCSRMGFGAKLAGGTLDLGRRGVVIAGPTKNLPNVTGMHAGPDVPETPAWPKDPPDNWAIYHLAHPTFTKGSPFDPNPALFYKGGSSVSSRCRWR